MYEEDREIELKPQETSIQEICSVLSAFLAYTLWLMGRGCSSHSKPLCHEGDDLDFIYITVYMDVCTVKGIHKAN